MGGEKFSMGGFASTAPPLVTGLVTPQKRSAKVARQLFWQVWENLGKNPLHPQEFACSYTYVSKDQQWVNNVLVHWHFCILKVICVKN